MEEKLLFLLKNIIIGSHFENHVFLVGGYVRDEMLGKPCKDIDLVIDLPNGGIEFAEFIIKEIGSYKKDSNPVIYPTYGTAKFIIKGFETIPIECVQSRKEIYSDKLSRKPSCKHGTLLEDALRRDLTINALYKNISNDQIIDPTNKGIDDLKNKILRTPCDPNLTFIDDPLRMLRVIRFSSRYGWEINEETLQAIIRNKERLSIISKERIQDEFNKILLSDNVEYGIKLLITTKLMDFIIPDFIFSLEIVQNKFHNETVGNHLISVCKKTKPILVLRLAAILHDLGKIKVKSEDNEGNVHFYQHELESKKMSESILKDLKYSNEIIEKVSFLIENHMRLKVYGNDLKNIKDKSIRKLINDCKDEETLNLLLDLIDADNKSHSEEYLLPNQIENLKNKIEVLKIKDEGNVMVKLPLNGDEIMDILNVKGGKIIGDIIKELTELYLENPLINKEECEEYIINNFKK